MDFNNTELKKLSSEKNVGIKVSFEDEGLDFIDVLGIKKLTLKHDIDLLLKVAGAEAKRDFKDANKIGVSKIVAPMIESHFAFKKYISSAKQIIKDPKTTFGFNMESKQCYYNLDEILATDEVNFLSAITVGRGDLAESFGFDRYSGGVNSNEIFNITKETFEKGKSKNLKCYLGGSMNKESADFCKELIDLGLLDYFETRNMVFSIKSLKEFKFEDLIELAFSFEFEKMNSRRQYYELLYNEDIARLNRLKKL